jgi:hypothetical protein
LILKVYDKDELYRFECVGIENRKQKYPIKIHDYTKYKKTGRKEVLKLQKEIHENYYKVAGLTSGDFVNGKWVSDNKPHPKIKYDPMELE